MKRVFRIDGRTSTADQKLSTVINGDYAAIEIGPRSDFDSCIITSPANREPVMICRGNGWAGRISGPIEVYMANECRYFKDNLGTAWRFLPIPTLELVLWDCIPPSWSTLRGIRLYDSAELAPYQMPAVQNPYYEVPVHGETGFTSIVYNTGANPMNTILKGRIYHPYADAAGLYYYDETILANAVVNAGAYRSSTFQWLVGYDTIVWELGATVATTGARITTKVSDVWL